jgi:hypothetical protein
MEEKINALPLPLPLKASLGVLELRTDFDQLGPWHYL